MDRSTKGIVHSALDVKAWLFCTPSVDDARPGRCPICGAASRPVGGALGLHGHGFRDRQQRGPLTVDDEPTTVVIAARRYVCVHCAAVIMVVPRGVAPRRHYAVTAIAMALALYGLCREPAREVRRRVSPWRTVGHAAVTGWATLRRWTDAIQRGELLPGARRSAPGATSRDVAERAAQGLCAQAPPSAIGLRLEAQAFLGGLRMA